MANVTKKDEMVIYIDSNPNNRIGAPVDTLFWRNNSTFFLVDPFTDALTRIDVPVMKDVKYSSPLYKNKKFVYANADETWQKTTEAGNKTGWILLKYAAPTIGGTQFGPVPPIPVPTPTVVLTGSFSGSFTGSFYGAFTGSYFVEYAQGDFTGTFYFITNSYYFSGSNYQIGTPIDGYYGSGSSGNVAGLVVGENVEDALDKLDTILDKLAPARPPNLSTKTLTLVGSYSAKKESTTTTFAGVTISQTPTFQLAGGMVTANGFGNGEVGELSASIDGTTTGDTVLSAADDTGTYGDLQITSDYDWWYGVAGKENFWQALLAQINVTTPVTSSEAHTASLRHSTTGTTAGFIWYVDDAVTPTAVVGQVTASGVTYISGVPALVGGVNSARVAFTASAADTVGRFYNATRIFSAGGSGLSTTNAALPVSPVSASVQTAQLSINVNGGSQTEAATFTINAYNSAGASATLSIPTTVRMDSTQDGSNRVSSSIGQYPASDYTTAFNPSSSLAVAGGEELQMLNGKYRYPAGNYTTALPVAGPNYSSVPVGSYSSMRWVTFNLGAIAGAVSLTLSFNSATNFTTGIMSSFALYVRVDGATPTVGWVDGNAAYPGVGNPTNNGDAAMDFTLSNVTAGLKVVVFGTAPKTGTVYVRVGIPVGSTKSFSSISMTAS